MNKNPLISVVTVCRNSREALEETSENIYSQNFKLYEHIIVDGASTDSTPAYLKNLYRENVKWVSEPDKGIYDAMNKGVNMASGEWVIFMNAGDKFAAPSTMASVADILEKVSDNTDVVYGDVIKEGKDGTPVIKKAEAPRDCHRMFFCHQSSFARRRALLKFPFDISHRLSADFKFFKTLIRHSRKFEKVDFPISLFDTTGVSNTRRSKGLADNISVILETDGLLKGFPHLIHLIPPYMISRLRGK